MDLEFKYVQGYNFKLIGIFGIGSGICNVILKMLKKHFMCTPLTIILLLLRSLYLIQNVHYLPYCV